MKLEDALRFNGYEIEQTNVEASTITVPEGTLVVPAMRLSSLVWRRAGEPVESDSFYLAALPVFDPGYQPVLLSHILDRFSTRRISYDMPGMFGLAVRRWLNREFGPMSVFNRLYTSTAVALPLTTQDATVDVTATELARDAHSDFPQGQLSGNLDYASNATDRAADNTNNTDYQGRMGRSVADLLIEQRTAYLNVDTLVLDSMESLFLGTFDRDEFDPAMNYEIGYPGNGYDVFGASYC